MERYLQHVRQSRERLAPIVQKMSERGHSIMVRGTIGEPQLSSLRCDKHNEHGSIPFYCGYPGSLDAQAATLIIDATLRKSISFSFTHFFKEFLFHSNSLDVLSQLQDYETEHGLLLAFIHGKNQALGSFAHLPRLGNGRGRSVYEAFRVGNEIIPTFADLNISIQMVARYLESDPSALLVPIQDSELRALASKVIVGRKSIAGLVAQPECYALASNALEKVSDSPPAFEEELKSTIWSLASLGSSLQTDIELFLLCVEIEIAMMEKMLSELEMKAPIPASRQGQL